MLVLEGGGGAWEELKKKKAEERSAKCDSEPMKLEAAGAKRISAAGKQK